MHPPLGFLARAAGPVVLYEGMVKISEGNNLRALAFRARDHPAWEY